MSKVEVCRFIRPSMLESAKVNPSLNGITILFNLDYDAQTVTAQWSICTGDNFNKSLGRHIAKKAPKFTFPMGTLNGVSLVETLLWHLGCSAAQHYLKKKAVLKKELTELRKNNITVYPKIGDKVVVVVDTPEYHAWSNDHVKGCIGVVEGIDHAGHRYGVEVLLEGWRYSQTCAVSDVRVLA